MKMENVETQNRLLHLIYLGETDRILKHQKFKDGLNHLMKYEFVIIKNEKLQLTERGIKALKEGINSVKLKVKTKIHRPQEPASQDFIKPSLFIAFLILLIIILGITFI
ncbi:hypothetical protein BH23BAC2_BH23BAC2_14160 [soil metagenome]